MKKPLIIYLFLPKQTITMTQNKKYLIIGSLLILFAALLKAATYPFSINPIIAISLFSGVIIKEKKYAFALPLLAMFASDIILEVFNIGQGFYGVGQIGNYASLLLITVLGFSMKKINPVYVGTYSIISTLLFFFLSNTNCFLFDNFSTYGSGIQGWANCLAAGIPFLKNGLATDLGFSFLLFGSYHLADKYYFRKALA